MAVFNGNSLEIRYALTSSGTKEIFAHANTATLEVSDALIDVTTKDSDSWAEMISGRKSFSLSTDSLVDYAAVTDAHNYEDVVDTLIAGTKIYFTFGSGSDTYEGEAFIASISVNGGSDEAATFSVSMTGTGQLTKS